MSVQFTPKERLRYRFDDWMSRGALAQILMLGALTIALIAVTAVVLIITGLAPELEGGQRESFSQLLWRGLMRAMDAGAVGGDSGSWPFLFVMLFITFGGIFVFSALIGILNGAIEGLLDSLSRGKSLVVEANHTVILGFTPKIHTLLSELAAANTNRKGACVVVLGEVDKREMDEALAAHHVKGGMRIVTRTGSPTSPADLSILNLPQARSVIVPAPEEDADARVLKTLLALTKVPGVNIGQPHVVAELSEQRTLDVARLVVGEKAALVLSPALVNRLLVQTGRQSGLSMVYAELLDFAGSEIYVNVEPKLVGKTFREALSAYDDSALMGVVDLQGELHLPPPFDRKFVTGDQVVAISRDDDTVVLNGRAEPSAVDISSGAPLSPSRRVERTLVLGVSERSMPVLIELDAYVARGSQTLLVGEGALALPPLVLANMAVERREGDITDRALLESLEPLSFDHVLLLSEVQSRTPDIADARTLITLLHLRDLAQKGGRHLPITTEMLELRNQDLASVAEADDFIVSDSLVSLLLTQVSENAHLVKILDDLFQPDGHEIYLKPVENYITPGIETSFYAIVEAAARRGHVALGYRVAHQSRDASKGFGVVVNPTKSQRRKFAPQDRVIVMSAD